MSAPATPPPAALAAKARVRELSIAPWISQAMYAIAKLGVPDHLVDGPRPVEEVAPLVGADPDTLHRLCRALASAGVLTEAGPRTYGLDEPGQQLVSGRPGSLRDVVVMHGEETFRAFADILHTARTGRPAFERVFGTSFYDYLRDTPEAEQLFHRAMGVSGRPPAVAGSLDLDGAKTVVDLGGGSGDLLAEVLTGHPGTHGVLLDLADAVEEGRRRMANAGLADRVRCVAGSFFDAVPEGDTYLLARVLHNWGDEDALRILRRVRDAIPPHGRLVVLDRLVPEVAGPHPGKTADLVMLVVLGGRDRTRTEYADLLAEAGFALESVVAPPPGADPRAESALVARPGGPARS
ncbi:methyltransferase [Streptomyces sp. NPDC006307]|uniref:methyltransferase n=1 Tax=Streptomyces sp. NPDC006307 TaxID=3156748 RepID=UPI0033A12C36